ncbi:trimethylamine methyltransferase family protein [Chloroflexi bacterium TSY]|nr:trimethylamine methyltransferase family protein [Chloroflexi bacterium TSY]
MPTERRRRRHRERGSSSEKVARIAQPFTNVPTYDLLTKEQLDQVHEKSMQILEEGGIAFLYEPALKIFREHGVKIVDDIVYLDRELVQEAVSKAPSVFTWSARNPERDVQIGGNAACFAPVVGPPFVMDAQGGRREGTHHDLENFLKMAHVTPYLQCVTPEICVSTDIPIAYRHLELMYSDLTMTDKPLMGVYHTGLTGTDSINMGQIVFGEEAVHQKHYLHCIVNVSSPRRLDDRMLSLLIAYAENNQIVNVTPFILSGAMGPVSILGTVAQLNAEALAGIVLAQLVNPGTPCVYGSFQAVVDMQSGAPVMGAPESQLALYISSQLARRYGLPFRGSGAYTSSKLIDAQGAYESLMSIFPALQAQPNFILHAAGWLEAGLTAGYEKFVLDLELVGMAQTFLKGVNWDADQWAMDAILHEVPPGGHHLGTEHTMRHYRTAFYRAELFDYDSGEAWLDNGAEDSIVRAGRKVQDLINSYEKPPIDPAIEEALRDYVERRKPQLTASMITG